MQNSLSNNADHPRNTHSRTLSRTTMGNLGKSRTSTNLKVDRFKDKELINNGLHKLISSLNTAHKINQKPSKLLNKSKFVTPVENPNSEKQANSHIVLSNQISSDKYTMTDCKKSEKKLDLESTVLGENSYNCQEGRDLQWTDPRLLKKYSLVNQPCKKALTVPYINKSDQNTEITENISDDDAPQIFYSEDKHFLFKCLYYIGTTSVSFVGSMCGIALIALIFWKIVDESVFTYFPFLTPKAELFSRGPITCLICSLYQILNSFAEKFMRLLRMSTNEVYATEEDGSWYKKYVKY